MAIFLAKKCENALLEKFFNIIFSIYLLLCYVTSSPYKSITTTRENDFLPIKKLKTYYLYQFNFFDLELFRKNVGS
jgi:hypothetical protein